MYRLISAIACFLALSIPAKSSTYYLDAINGNDLSPGTAAQPWKTLAKSKSTLLSGDSVILNNGNYGAYIENLNTSHRTDWVTYLAGPGQTAVIFNYIDVDGLEVDAYLHFEGIDIFYPQQPTCPSSGGAIEITSFSGVNFIAFYHCKIHGVQTYDSGGGIYFNHKSNALTPVHDLLVDHCEIFNTTTGIRFSGSKTTLTNNHIHHIHGTMIGNLCGPMSADDQNSATNVLIENNHLHDMHFYTAEPCYNTPGWSTAHASVIGIRGHDWILRGNEMHDTWSPVIQLYGDDCGGTYDRSNILFENNIIYDHQGYSLFYNPGTDSSAFIGGPVVFRHNTIISGRQDSTWTSTDPAADRFSADGHVQSASLNLFPSPPNPYDGTGAIFEDNIFLLSARIGNYNYQKFDDSTAKWIARNNLIYVKSWNAGTLDPSNLILSDSIKSGALPADFIDHQLFTAPNYSMGHTQTQAPNSAFDLSPLPGSILCTMSSTGGYIGAIPCEILSKIIAVDSESAVLVFPNPASNQINVSIPSSAVFTLEILNTQGQRVMQSAGKNTLDVSTLPIGIYLLRVRTDDKVYLVSWLKI